MKAFLLAAGHGTRLRPLTDHTPKCLLPIQGRPMLDIWLDLLARHGVDEVLINAHALSDVVRAHLSSTALPLAVRLEEEPVLLGSAGTLRHHRQWVANDPVFWVCYADVLTNCDFGALLERHREQRPLATLGLYRVPDPRRCGIAQLAGDRIVAFEEKPERPATDLAFSGIMLLDPAALDRIPPRQPADIGADLLPRLTGEMAYVVTEDFLLDVGTLANYDLAQASWPGLEAVKEKAHPGSTLWKI